jgi:tetratricopeptide (TPR) repeat protein
MTISGDTSRAAQGYYGAGDLSTLEDYSAAESYNNLGNALYREGKLTEATKAYERAMRLLPDMPEILYNLGAILHEQGDLDRAVDCYRQVLRVNPASVEACHNLATALKEQGHLDEAVSQFRETLRLRPLDMRAYSNLSDLAAAGRYHFAPQELERLRAFKDLGRGSALERSLCRFTIAGVLDRQGAYDEAFGYYQEANDLRLRLAEASKTGFDAPSHAAIIDAIIATHDRGYFERVRGWGLDSELPIFIVGMPRSGSTLVEQILASHPRVFGAGELGEITRFIKAPAPQTSGEVHAPFVPIHQGAARDMARSFLERITRLDPGASRVTIKTLGNFVHLGIIATLFPKARIIHCRRDPLDVCLSCYFQNFQKIVFAWSLNDLGAYYSAYEKTMTHWDSVLPSRIHEVSYEKLVHGQEEVTRNLLAFCGLDWDERCLTFFNTRRVVRTASSIQVRNPISTQAVGRWKHYRSHLGPLFKSLGRSFEADSGIVGTKDPGPSCRDERSILPAC